jgi:hypothetical protein
MKTVSGLFCAAFCLFLSLPQARASSICTAISGNLVTNCGFETGDSTGWTLTGNDVPLELNNLYGVEGVDPIDGISPNSGSYQVYIADLDANATTLTETLGTVAGSAYVVSWYLAQDTAPVAPYSNLFSASFGGVTLVSLSAVPVEGYTKYTSAAVATSSSTVLSLTVADDLGEFLLDDVSVTLAPEPAAWALTLCGTTLAFIFRKKRLV